MGQSNLKGKLSAVNHLVRTYLTAMPHIIYRSTLSLLSDPKGTQLFIHQVLNARDLESDDPVLGSSDVLELIGGNGTDVEIVGPYYSRRSSDTRILMELASLAITMQELKPKLIFEIGTFVGRTTRLLARNSPSTCRILTLDLSPEQVPHKIGEAFLSTEEAKRITQLHGDSLSFDLRV